MSSNTMDIIANCSVCDHELQCEKIKSGKENVVCTNCSAGYVFKNGYLNLLAPSMRDEICTKGLLARIIKEKLHVGRLSKNDHDIIRGIIASKYMARQYFRNVVHPTEAAWSARSYERFEEIFIMNYLDDLLKKKQVTFVDVGSGPGRYLILLGSKIGKSSCKDLKKNSETGRLYQYDANYEKNLKYVIGIDYSEEMISHSTKILKKYGLGPYLNKRIFPVTGIAQNFNLNKKMLDGTHKVIVCTFQTLGNQENAELQVQMLKSMKKLASPHGTIIVSVFNKKLFKDFGLKKFYGREVKRTVGEIVGSKQDVQNAILRTSKGVYSKWFSKDDLEDLFCRAKISRYTIMDEKSLQPIVGYDEYLKAEEQRKDVFPRAIVGMAQI
ncbi:MAG TPA: class I SAM-dependent methyltransferase [Candidatus Nitrosotalea sp.]|nr:class I SAM-dependent methyltransferase [Candidatus Nitrosotalea sp.]